MRGLGFFGGGRVDIGGVCRPASVAAALAVLTAFSQSALAYDPPIGIPEPPFGIDESHTMYAGKTYAAGGFQYRDAGNGPYTHYVHDTSGCTNTDNPYGTADTPRCSIPTTLPAGSVVEIHGGPYSVQSLRAEGTAEEPVFVRGVGLTQRALIEAEAEGLSLDGTYMIAEFLDLPGVQRVSLRGDFIALRGSYLHDRPQGVGQFVQMSGNYGVVYQNEITRNGGTDRHGVGVGGGTQFNWILENHIHDNSGDAIQFCHGCIGSGNGPAHVYIGGNELHDDHENAIDIKEARGPIVISQNRIYGYEPTSTSNGDAIRLNDEGDQGTIWIVANRISDSRLGIQPQNSHGVAYVIGNVIYNINNSAIGPDADYVIGNTIYNVGTGIGGGSEVRNNIIVNANTHISSDVFVCSHNLAFQTGGGVSVPNACSNQINEDPLFQNVATADFRIGANSPARNSGVATSHYQTYQAQIGESIAFDNNGDGRPQEGAWDRGALEYGGLRTVPIPAAPVNLVVQ